MRVLRTILLTVLLCGMMSVAAAGTGVALGAWDGELPWSEPTDAPSPAAAEQPAGTPAGDPAADPAAAPATPEPRPVAGQPTLAPTPNVLEPGDRGELVRELQHRLFQMAWWPEKTTGVYGPETKEAVAGWQAKRGLPTTGVVDPKSWKTLRSMTETPTHDQKFNILRPGPTILGPGAEGDDVRDLQARLKQIAWWFGDVTGTYGAETVEAVRGFQEKRGIPTTGEVDQRTLDRLDAMTSKPSHAQMHNIKPKPGALHPDCMTGRAMCVDKARNNLRWVIDGKVQLTVDVRFGSDELPTREGFFRVQRKSRDHVSSLYDTSMPYAMFFSGGQAVHYSPDFAANGYNGASHGCVNVRDRDAVAWLFDQVNVGDKVIVYWS